MSGIAGPGVGGNNGADAALSPKMVVVSQYTKDLSFENPAAPASPTAAPKVDLSVDLQTRQLNEDFDEVDLRMRVTATHEDKPFFLLELVYSGVFRIQNCPEDMRRIVLMTEAPRYLFPFARRIISDVMRDGGMRPFLIDPIDFASLYREQVAGA